jgi:hypothetical protein
MTAAISNCTTNTFCFQRFKKNSCDHSLFSLSTLEYKKQDTVSTVAEKTRPCKYCTVYCSQQFTTPLSILVPRGFPPDPGQFNADPDPAPHQGDANMRPLAITDPPGLHFERPRHSTALLSHASF